MANREYTLSLHILVRIPSARCLNSVHLITRKPIIKVSSSHSTYQERMENELLKRLVAIIARFDQGILDAPGNIGIDKPAIREAKLILSSDDDTSFVYDLNHNDVAEIVGQFSLFKKGEDDVVTPIPISSFVQEGNIEGIATKDILLN